MSKTSKILLIFSMLLIVITGLSELLIAVASLKVILLASTLSFAFIGVLVAFIAESRNVKNTLNKIEQAILNSKKGINSKGESIGDYSWYTKAIKTEKGQPTDRVTLKDTGEFYNSFITYWNDTGNGEIQIDADTIKEGGDDLLIDWGRDIIGLSEESLSKLRDMARIKLKQIVLEKLAA